MEIEKKKKNHPIQACLGCFTRCGLRLTSDDWSHDAAENGSSSSLKEDEGGRLGGSGIGSALSLNLERQDFLQGRFTEVDLLRLIQGREKLNCFAGKVHGLRRCQCPFARPYRARPVL